MVLVSVSIISVNSVFVSYADISVKSFVVVISLRLNISEESVISALDSVWWVKLSIYSSIIAIYGLVNRSIIFGLIISIVFSVTIILRETIRFILN